LPLYDAPGQAPRARRRQDLVIFAERQARDLAAVLGEDAPQLPGRHVPQIDLLIVRRRQHFEIVAEGSGAIDRALEGEQRRAAGQLPELDHAPGGRGQLLAVRAEGEGREIPG
jgi:hypothetical protein